MRSIHPKKGGREISVAIVALECLLQKSVIHFFSVSTGPAVTEGFAMQCRAAEQCSARVLVDLHPAVGPVNRRRYPD